jgi:hypothetical protein
VVQRTGFTDSALVRLLGQLRDGGTGRAPAPQAGFAERLGEWLGWTDAISLSAVLQAAPPDAPDALAAQPAGADARECAATRAALARAIREDNVLSAAPGRAPRQLLPGEQPAPPATDFAPYRQRYLIRQQAMEAAVDVLRERLRDRLASVSPEAAQLAALDAVMAPMLEARARGLLATAPALLESHFARMRAAAEAAAQPAADWLARFCQDMQALLLAELDFRFSPVQGLIEALHPTGSAALHA